MKQGDPRAALKAREVADFLKGRGLKVFAERAVVEGVVAAAALSPSPAGAAAAAAAARLVPSFSDLLPFDPRGPASTSEEEEEEENGDEGNGDDEERRRRRVEQEGAALASASASASSSSSTESSSPLWSPRGTGSGAGSGAGRGAPLPSRGGARSLSTSKPPPPPPPPPPPSSSFTFSDVDGDDGNDDPDFCVTLGGDGTVLSLASLFDVDGVPLPPVLSLAMGTLGFLTPFDAREAIPALEALLAANEAEASVFCTLRTRKICSVLDAAGRPQGPARHVLNECLIDRGSSPAIVALEVAVDGTRKILKFFFFFFFFFFRDSEIEEDKKKRRRRRRRRKQKKLTLSFFFCSSFFLATKHRGASHDRRGRRSHHRDALWLHGLLPLRWGTPRRPLGPRHAAHARSAALSVLQASGPT